MSVTRDLPYQYKVSSRTRNPLTAAVFHSYRRLPESLLRQQNSLHTTKIKYISQQPHYYFLHYWKKIRCCEWIFHKNTVDRAIKWIWPWTYSSNTSSDTTVAKRYPCRMSIKGWMLGSWPRRLNNCDNLQRVGLSFVRPYTLNTEWRQYLYLSQQNQDNKHCEIWGSNSGDDENSSLLRCQ